MALIIVSNFKPASGKSRYDSDASSLTTDHRVPDLSRPSGPDWVRFLIHSDNKEEKPMSTDTSQKQWINRAIKSYEPILESTPITA
jgi:hypothetical protein